MTLQWRISSAVGHKSEHMIPIDIRVRNVAQEYSINLRLQPSSNSRKYFLVKFITKTNKLNIKIVIYRYVTF